MIHDKRNHQSSPKQKTKKTLENKLHEYYENFFMT